MAQDGRQNTDTKVILSDDTSENIRPWFAIKAVPLGLAGSGNVKHRHCSQQAHTTATFQGVPIADGRVGFVSTSRH